MKIYIVITSDGYYGGWFSGAFDSSEMAVAALQRDGFVWKEVKNGKTIYDHDKRYLEAYVKEYEVNTLSSFDDDDD